MIAKRSLTSLAGLGALVFLFTASKCQNQTDFPPFVQEVCTDNIDNDEDGRIDCQDSDCKVECPVTVTIGAIASPVPVDSLIITGTHFNASTVQVSISPSGSAGVALISGSTWQSRLTGLTEQTTYNVTVVATDSSQRSATATASFERKN